MSYCNCRARQAFTIFVLVASTCATNVARASDEAQSLHVSGASAAEQQLEIALEEEADFDFYELPIVDLVEYLRERLRAPVILDQAALADEGYDPQQLMVTGTFEQTPLSSALFAVLLPLDLDLTISHDVLWITTRDVADYQLITRCYETGDLVDAWNVSFPSPTDPPGNHRRTGSDRKVMSYSQCEIHIGAPATPEDALIGLVTSIVEPDSWDANGGEGALNYCRPSRVLVVSQSYRVHRKLASLLAQLTTRVPHASPPVATHVRPVPNRNTLLEESPCWQELLDLLTR